MMTGGMSREWSSRVMTLRLESQLHGASKVPDRAILTVGCAHIARSTISVTGSAILLV